MRIFSNILLLLLLLFSGSCSHDKQNGDIEEPKPLLEVNYTNISGVWQLTEWNGEKMNDTRYYYLVFNQKAENGKHTYIIYTNLNSATSQQITGNFVLENSLGKGDLISGIYDYRLSTDEGWSHKYIIASLYEDSMVWTAKDDVSEIRVYSRCEDIPADIQMGIRVVEGRCY